MVEDRFFKNELFPLSVQKSFMTAKNILFDLGNVLIDLDIPETFRKLQALIGDEHSEGAEDKINQMVFRYERGELSNELFINAILKLSRREIQAGDVIDAWNAMLKGIPERRMDWLREMKKHHRMAVFSNTNDLHIAWVRSYLKRAHPDCDFEREFFENIFYSHQLGCRKPETECFEKVLNELGWKPKDTVFIDDTEENVKAADQAGMTGIQLMPEIPVEELIPPGSLISSLPQSDS